MVTPVPPPLPALLSASRKHAYRPSSRTGRDRHDTLRRLIREEIRNAFRAELVPSGPERATEAPPSDNFERYLSTTRAAELADVTPGTVRAWIREGRLPACRRGRLLRIKRSDLDVFLATATRTHGPVNIAQRAREILSRKRRR